MGFSLEIILCQSREYSRLNIICHFVRSAFDPKTFYKKLDSTKFPKYFQMGTVVESSADFYSGPWEAQGGPLFGVCLLAVYCLLARTKKGIASESGAFCNGIMYLNSASRSLDRPPRAQGAEADVCRGGALQPSLQAGVWIWVEWAFPT